MKFKKILISLSLLLVLFAPVIVSAAILENSLITEADCSGPNGCTLNTFVRLGISVAEFILGIVGALTLVMFIYGGFMWVLSGGSSDKVQKGKDIIIGSIVGLLIVFSSYTIIRFTTNNLLQGTFNDTAPADTKMEKTITPKAGDKCRALPGPGRCTTDTCFKGGPSGTPAEATDKSDCGGVEHCCYKVVACSNSNPTAKCMEAGPWCKRRVTADNPCSNTPANPRAPAAGNLPRYCCLQ